MADNTDLMISEIVRRLRLGDAEACRQHEEVITRIAFIERAIDRMTSFGAWSRSLHCSARPCPGAAADRP